MTKQEKIDEIMGKLKTRGYFDSVQEIEDFFEKSLWEVAEIASK